ncbi:MAG: hypothetical protein K9N23_04590 [Akkermansiaceae bacterium]|nr:hypothetical protein [Akkermansiaceae bacterium]
MADIVTSGLYHAYSSLSYYDEASNTYEFQTHPSETVYVDESTPAGHADWQFNGSPGYGSAASLGGVAIDLTSLYIHGENHTNCNAAAGDPRIVNLAAVGSCSAAISLSSSFPFLFKATGDMDSLGSGQGAMQVDGVGWPGKWAIIKSGFYPAHLEVAGIDTSITLLGQTSHSSQFGENGQKNANCSFLAHLEVDENVVIPPSTVTPAYSPSHGSVYRTFTVTVIDAGSGIPPQFLGDTDYDGQADWLELEAGSNANDPADRFEVQSIQRSGDDMVISWRGAGGITYQVESISLTGGPSTPVGAPITAAGARPLLSVTDAGVLNAHISRFYRVKVITP